MRGAALAIDQATGALTIQYWMVLKKLPRVLPIVGLEGVLNVQQDPRTRQYATVYGPALVDVAHGFAVEPRISGELWAKNVSQGIGGGLGVSYRR